MYNFEKAFYRQNRNILITLLSDMGCPGWLLRLAMAFLRDRVMIRNYRGCKSGRASLPGGGPQGTKLGMYLFLILINYAGFTQDDVDKKIRDIIVKSSKRKRITKIQEKYVDDMTQAVSIILFQIGTFVAFLT